MEEDKGIISPSRSKNNFDNLQVQISRSLRNLSSSQNSNVHSNIFTLWVSIYIPLGEKVEFHGACSSVERLEIS
jgi:hypothetical protein